MKHDIVPEVEEYTKKHQRRKHWYEVVALLACVVMLCTLYALVLPAVTMGQDTCDLPEHTHSETCYDEDGTLICELDEHTHSDACRSDNSDASGHTHDETCYAEDGTLICDLQESQNDQPDPTEESVHTSDEPSNDENETQPADSNETQPADLNEPQDNQTDDSANDAIQPLDEGDSGTGEEANPLGALDIKLLYPDHAPHETYGEEGYTKTYTTTQLTGYIDLDPSNLKGDLKDMQLVVRMPKEFVDQYEVTNFAVKDKEEHKIIKTEDDTNYILTIDFSLYQQSLAMQIEFKFSLLDNKTPADYKLPVTAEVIINGVSVQTTPPNYYRPLYDDLFVLKAIFDSKFDLTADGTVVPISAGRDENNNPIIDENGRANTGENPPSIPFLFAVNGYNYYGSIEHRVDKYRDCNQITVTDILPQYEDQYGNTQYAVLDQELSLGWVLDETNHTVSKTYYGTGSGNVFKTIIADRLWLKFPNLPLTKITNDKNEPCYAADLSNKVKIEAVPSNMTAGETPQYPEDELKFVLSTEIASEGELSKAASGDIYDLMADKSKEYRWALNFKNKGLNPIRHLTIQDRKITNDNGDVENPGLDPALKFTRLESVLGNSKLAEGQTFADIIDKITAYYDDNGVECTHDFFVNGLDAGGNFNINLTHPDNPEMPCSGFDIVFKDDYEMGYDENVCFYAYSLYRDPKNTHTVGETSTRYRNYATCESWYVDMEGTTHFSRPEKPLEASYIMKPVIERLRIDKNNHYGQSGDRTHIGDTFEFRFVLSGLLLPDEDKQYGDFRIIDLLPPGLTFIKCYTYGTKALFGSDPYYTPEIIENYKNTGCTALIFQFTADGLRQASGNRSDVGTEFLIQVEINKDAMPGIFQNNVYLMEPHLNEPRNDEAGVKDVYDMDDDNDTNDLVRHSVCNYTVSITNAIFASKFIAPAGADSWTMQRLDIMEGTDFDYRLCVTNAYDAQSYSSLVIYDTLPKNGDMGLLQGAKPRGSEFEVHLRQAIEEIPDGYTVYYTNNADAYKKTMEEMVNQDIWLTESEVDDFEAVTAFKMVANEGTVLKPQESFNARIPVRAVEKLSDESIQMLHGKYESYLEAVNTFAFTVAEAPNPKESNPVRVRIPFAEFTLKKVDDRTNGALSGAEFTLTDEAGAVISTITSDENGIVRFKDLIAGTYTLTETRAPAGYYEPHVSLTVTITQDPHTLEYHVKFDGDYPGAGTADDPLVIGNHASYELPATGGIGTAWHKMAGLLLILAALSGALYCRINRKTADCTNS